MGHPLAPGLPRTRAGFLSLVDSRTDPTLSRDAARAFGQTWQCQTSLAAVDAARAQRSLIVTALAPINDADMAAGQGHAVVTRSVGERPAPEAILRATRRGRLASR